MQDCNQSIKEFYKRLCSKKEYIILEARALLDYNMQLILDVWNNITMTCVMALDLNYNIWSIFASLLGESLTIYCYFEWFCVFRFLFA